MLSLEATFKPRYKSWYWPLPPLQTQKAAVNENIWKQAASLTFRKRHLIHTSGPERTHAELGCLFHKHSLQTIQTEPCQILTSPKLDLNQIHTRRHLLLTLFWDSFAIKYRLSSNLLGSSGWPENSDPPVSASRLAGIASPCHHAWLSGLQLIGRIYTKPRNLIARKSFILLSSLCSKIYWTKARQVKSSCINSPLWE
jgi:hypothetical protein